MMLSYQMPVLLLRGDSYIVYSPNQYSILLLRKLALFWGLDAIEREAGEIIEVFGLS